MGDDDGENLYNGKRAMKIFVSIIAAALLVVGTWLLAVGVAHQSSFLSTPLFTVPLAEVVVEPIKKMPLQNRIQVVGRHGLLPLLGGVGGAAALVGLLMLVLVGTRAAKMRTEEKPMILPPLREKAKDGKQMAKKDAAQMDNAAAAEEDEWDNVPSLTALSESPLTAEICHKLLAKFHPELHSFINLFDDEALFDFTRHFLACLILRHRQNEKDLTAEEFRQRERRLNEAQRETVVRRYMPKAAAGLAAKEHIGRVFSLSRQHQIQQDGGGGADDWMDISMRNAQAVLSLPVGDNA